MHRVFIWVASVQFAISTYIWTSSVCYGIQHGMGTGTWYPSKSGGRTRT
jgi:hypothetical protein